MVAANYKDRLDSFRKSHESGCFVIPNPWDIGSARYLQHLGFSAVATTSAGFAFSRGVIDTAVPRDAMLSHIAEIVAAVDLPVNADFESGYSPSPDGVGGNVRLCVATGVAGLSIEDSTGRRDKPLYDLPEAVDRMKAARAAIDESGAGVLLTGRAECYLVGHPDPLKESVRRLQAYSEAGADVLYAPGVHQPDEIRTVVSEVAPKPVNVLIGWNSRMGVRDLAELGVRRISVGSGLARTAWGSFMRAAQTIAKEGRFTGFDSAVSFAEITKLFTRK